MPEKGSYLTTVKEELKAVVDEIAADADLDQEGIVVRLWKFMEPKMKESFSNGKKAAGNGHSSTGNAFNRRK